MKSQSRPRILQELRPAAEGFAGIPQETRLLFAMLNSNSGLDLTGLLNSHNRLLPYPKSLRGAGWHRRGDELYDMSSRMLSLQDADRWRDRHRVFRASERVYQLVDRMRQAAAMRTMIALRREIEIHDLETEPFFDLIWGHYLSKSLGASQMQILRDARFATIRYGWRAMHRSGWKGADAVTYPKMDTSDYDIYIAQTPWPSRVSPGTKLVVRYHDAIPIFYPHTIHNAHWHQYTHYQPLKANLKAGAIMVYNSENSRNEVLAMFPERAGQTHVIPCVVSDAYAARPAKEPAVNEIIRGSIEPTTEPSFVSSSEAEEFYVRHLGEKPIRYLLVVSTIEPRKNHKRLISAWRSVANELAPELKLVIVGRPGWHSEDTLKTMGRFQRRGRIFNVSGLSPMDLRVLYANADAVVCPSIAEGFDLTGIEAMLSDGVVVASDIPVHREIYSDACVYFDPYSTQSMAGAIAKFVKPQDPELHASLMQKGKALSRNFLADKIGPQWTKFLEETVDQKRKNGAKLIS